MSRFVVSAAARQDLRDIQSHIAADNFEAARRVIRRLRTSFRQLAQHPQSGHARPDLTDQPVHFWPVYSYLIVYKPDTRPLEIVRVVHGARDLERSI
jgi:antitoxin ParD1/3/4/toxin ParE1/3/4